MLKKNTIFALAAVLLAALPFSCSKKEAALYDMSADMSAERNVRGAKQAASMELADGSDRNYQAGEAEINGEFERKWIKRGSIYL